MRRAWHGDWGNSCTHAACRDRWHRALRSGDFVQISDFLTDVKDWATYEGMDKGPSWWVNAGLSKRIMRHSISGVI